MSSRGDPVGTIRRCFVLIALIAATIGGILPTAATAEAKNDAIGAGDLVEISVYGEEGVARVLSGQFRVAGDGTIQYPLVGTVAVGGMTPAEVAQMISASLDGQAPISGMPTIRVAEYAPVFLIGDVQRTGPVPFEPGMTVFRLVLLAGGVPPAPLDQRDPLSADQEISDLELLSFSLAVKRARLQAEVDQADFDGASFLAGLSPEMSRVVQHQVSIFLANQRATESQARAYEAQKSTYDQEIESLKESIALHDDELRLLEDQVATQQDLVNRGLAPQSRLVDLKRQLAVTRRESLEFRTALFQAQQHRLDVEQKLSDARLSSHVLSLEALSDVELNLQRTNNTLSHLKSLAPLPAPAELPEGTFGPAARYTLLRFVDGRPEASVADETTRLQRGDILRVDLVVETGDVTVEATDDTRAAPKAGTTAAVR
jgi:polysaccharide export outer membrane protein